MLHFRKFTMDDKTVLDEYLYNYGENSCQHSFVMMYVMNDKYGDEICIEDKCLYILRSNMCTDKERVYLYPFTKESNIDKALDNILEDAALHGSKAVFYTVTEQAKETIQLKYGDRFIYQDERDYSEYIYKAETLRDLPGRKLAPKRTHVRNFMSNYSEWMRIEVFGRKNIIEEYNENEAAAEHDKRIIEDILYFQDRYLIEKQDSSLYSDFLKEDARIRKTLENYVILGIRGIALYIDSTLAGYAYGAPLSDNCIDEIAEKGDISYSAIYQMVNQIFSDKIGSDFKYINREEDIGLEGLRKAKLSYQPCLLMSKYIAKEK